MKNIKKIEYDDFNGVSLTIRSGVETISPIPSAENLAVIVSKINEIIERINTVNK